MTTTATSDETTQKGPLKGRGLIIVAIAALAAAIPTLVFIFAPPLQRAGVAFTDALTRAQDVSYDPALPVEPYIREPVLSGLGAFMLSLLIIAVISVLAVVVVYFCLAWPLFRGREDSDDDDVIGSACVAGFVGLVALGISTSILIEPHTESAINEQEAPAHIAQWAEGRYGLSVDESTAEAFLEEARNGGAPVLVEGRFLNLTRIAQGGYVLTEDDTATELPTNR